MAVDVRLDAARREVDLFGAPFQGIDQGEAAAAWLTEALGTPSRLVRVPPEHARVTDGELAGTSGYADSSAVLVLSTSSLDLLNERIVVRGGAPLRMNRFRPNVVVTGWDEPHREDQARRISIGDAELGYAKLAVRCVVTLVEQESGARKARNRCARWPTTAVTSPPGTASCSGRSSRWHGQASSRSATKLWVTRWA